MATILEFTARQEDRQSDQTDAEAAKSGETAQIIFFPGIRIERYETDPFEDDALTAVARDAAKSSKA